MLEEIDAMCPRKAGRAIYIQQEILARPIDRRTGEQFLKRNDHTTPAKVKSKNREENEKRLQLVEEMISKK